MALGHGERRRASLCLFRGKWDFLHFLPRLHVVSFPTTRASPNESRNRGNRTSGLRRITTVIGGNARSTLQFILQGGAFFSLQFVCPPKYIKMHSFESNMPRMYLREIICGVKLVCSKKSVFVVVRIFWSRLGELQMPMITMVDGRRFKGSFYFDGPTN